MESATRWKTLQETKSDQQPRGSTYIQCNWDWKWHHHKWVGHLDQKVAALFRQPFSNQVWYGENIHPAQILDYEGITHTCRNIVWISTIYGHDKSGRFASFPPCNFDWTNSVLLVVFQNLFSPIFPCFSWTRSLEGWQMKRQTYSFVDGRPTSCQNLKLWLPRNLNFALFWKGLRTWRKVFMGIWELCKYKIKNIKLLKSRS